MVRHLTVANSLFILCRGIPEAMAALGMENFLNNVGCKLVFYLQAIGRGVSFSTTCLLSVFQAITISPQSSRLSKLKVKALKYTGHCTIISWILHLGLNIRVPMLVSDKRNNKSITNTIDFQYCSAMSAAKDKTSIFVALTLSHDILCLKLMIWSSASMVFILYRHKHRMRHVHKLKISTRSPENRVSQSILILVCAFISFYALYSFTYVCFTFYDMPSLWLVKTSALIYAGFPTVSPFVLMTREQNVRSFMWKERT
ncbi:vomeronasal type-1 receptor 4-like [Octodon degus]|uniref:Vomeronasal type-1 receptor n=1 Tax=Octodon degus TaxID=10160 RepID=A0A6P3FWM4_OCTDE|nr:vomeronasal type-1 receptor 4-like [Octodon degus]